MATEPTSFVVSAIPDAVRTTLPTLTKDKLRYWVLSDIHLGHPKNATRNILHNLTVFFNHFAPRDDLDVVFLAGDVFDRLLDFASGEVNDIIIWVSRLVHWCAINNIKLRILEGTPSHDWMQSSVFPAVEKMHAWTQTEIFATVQAMSKTNQYTAKVDMKYVTTLSIEVIEEFGLSVLYVPDEWHTDPNETFRQVQDIMRGMALETVDIAIMHGSFGYQLPPAALKVPKHDEMAYLTIVKYVISIGHIHLHSVYQRIVAQGSFDRLAHNEEDPKGAVEIVLYRDGRYEYHFIENKLAMIFKTITIKQTDIDSIMLYIEKRVNKLPMDSHVRIKSSRHNPVMIGFDEVKRRFPMLHFTKKSLEEEEQDNYNLNTYVAEDDGVYVPITITRDNLYDMLLHEMRQRYPLTTPQLVRMGTILEELKL